MDLHLSTFPEGSLPEVVFNGVIDGGREGENTQREIAS